MRVKCEVDVVLRPVAGCSVQKASRASRAIVTVGKEGSTPCNNARITMLISTFKNRHGTKYQLSGNILQLHARFVDEGKGTISLRDPAQDVFITKADPLQLKSLLTVLRLVAKGDDLSKCSLFSSVTPPSASGMKTLQTTLVITKRHDYPLTTSFPGALKSLTVNGITMKRLDPRIQDLRHLQTLNLSSNALTTLPDTAGRWACLSELDLSSNQLSAVPAVLYKSCVKNSLLVLRMNQNQLTSLPLQLYEIRRLVQLHVDGNNISALPPNIGSFSQLYILSAQRNQISQLPGSVSRLRMECLDLFGNPILQIQDNVLVSNNLGVPSLRELAARFIRRKGLAYSEGDLLRDLIYYLNNARQCCCCGRCCFESCARFLRKCDLHELSKTVHAWNTLGNTTVPVETFLCSTPCLEKFRNNPARF